jgi:hypothetical protein
MTVGISSANLCTPWLNVLRGTNATGIATPFIKLHTGDPGAAGANLASAVTTRVACTWAAPASNAIALNGTLPSWSMTTTETISHISLWDASTAGNFIASVALTVPQAVVNTNTFVLNTLGVTFTPIAA